MDEWIDIGIAVLLFLMFGSKGKAATSGQTYTVVSGDTLSGLSQSFYGDMHLWWLIYSNNQGTIGENPNDIQPGMQLQIAALNSYSQQDIDNAKAKFSSWSSYNSGGVSGTDANTAGNSDEGLPGSVGSYVSPPTPDIQQSSNGNDYE